MKFNIIILSADSQPEFIGGIKRVTSILAKEWIKMGNNVLYLTFCNNVKRYDPKYNSFEGINQFFISNNENIESELNLENIKKNKINTFSTIILNPHVEDEILAKFSIFLKNKLKAKLVQALHFHPNFEDDIIKKSFFSNYRFKGLNPLKQSFIDSLLSLRYYIYGREKKLNSQSEYLTYIYNSSDTFIALSDSFLPILKKKIKVLDYSKLKAINNPSQIFHSSINFENKKRVVLWAGRMDNYCKRIDRMLKIWNAVVVKNPDWKLKVIGSGDLENIKRNIKKEKIKNIEVLGFHEPEPFYKEASIVCSTSVSEGWGMTLIEGMEYGCVPIAYNNGGSINDIIFNEINGFIIPESNIKDYVKRLDYLMKNNNKRIEMAKKAHSSITKFDPSHIADQWIDLFK